MNSENNQMNLKKYGKAYSDMDQGVLLLLPCTNLSTFFSLSLRRHF